MIFKTTNDGQSWTVISPDLSTQDPARIVSSGGIIGDNLGQFYGEVVFAIAPSKIQSGLIWAGTNDGKVWYTQRRRQDLERRDEERHGPAGVGHDPEDRAVALRRGHGVRRGRLPHDGQPRAVHLQDHRLRPHVDSISDALPTGHPLDYVMSVAENPNRKVKAGDLLGIQTLSDMVFVYESSAVDDVTASPDCNPLPGQADQCRNLMLALLRGS